MGVERFGDKPILLIAGLHVLFLSAPGIDLQRFLEFFLHILLVWRSTRSAVVAERVLGEPQKSA